MQDFTSITKRNVSPELENILYDEIPVLDHGFIRVVDYMGNDASIVQAARVSYGRGTKTQLNDKGLINYLMRHYHTTPFEMCEIKLHVKLPIFVARQWIRHRTANVNEYSARYSILDKEFYIPSEENIAYQSTTNKQGRKNQCVDQETAKRIQNMLINDAEMCYKHYQEMLNITDDTHNSTNQTTYSEQNHELNNTQESKNTSESQQNNHQNGLQNTNTNLSPNSQASNDANNQANNQINNGKNHEKNESGISRELARTNLTLNYYTQWYWKIDLNNLLHFVRLRADSHAQYEIRAYAMEMLKILKLWVPYAYDAFMNHRMESMNVSKKSIELINKKLNGQAISQEDSGLSKREWTELQKKFNI